MNNTTKDNSNEENNLSQILKDSESEEKTSIDFLLKNRSSKKSIEVFSLSSTLISSLEEFVDVLFKTKKIFNRLIMSYNRFVY